MIFKYVGAGGTPPHRAASEGHGKVVVDLLKAGANVNAKESMVRWREWVQ